MISLIKIVLAFLLLLCLATMPYGYYQLVRFLSFIGFGILAMNASNEKTESLMLVYIGLALLFQPFFKIALGRELWNIVDVIVAIFLIGSLISKRSDKK